MAQKYEFPTLVTLGPEAARNPYSRFKSEGKQDTIHQRGLLYTSDGRVIPDQVTAKEMERLTIPGHLKYLIRNTPAEQPAPAEEFDGEALEMDFDMDELERDEDDEDPEQAPYRKRESRGLIVMDRTPEGPSKRTTRRG